MATPYDSSAKPTGDDVRVRVVLFANLAGLLPSEAGGRTTLDVPAGSTVDDVLDKLGVPLELRTFVTLGGKRVSGDVPVPNGAEVHVIVPLGGG